MYTIDFKNKRVGIIGLSVEGISTLKFMISNGANVLVYEQREKDNLDREALEIINKNNIKGFFGPGYLNNLKEVDYLIRTPGMPLWHEKIQNALKEGVSVLSHTQIFFSLCPCPIIGVTGTKGKGTTSTLIYEMIKTINKNVYLGGNIGTPPLSFIDRLSKDSCVVLELSSFQLEDLKKSPHIAVVLNIGSDHLGSSSIESPNYHRSNEEYINAKKNILRFQDKGDIAILNYDSVNTKALEKETNAKVYFFSNRSSLNNGSFVENNKIVIKTSNELTVCNLAEVGLIGKHNLENVTAAVITSHLLNIPVENIKSVIKTFKGLEHRLEFVRNINGVSYYNDSFSTVPETAIAAIQTFKNPTILICGGSEKKSDYINLGKEIILSNVKAVILIGATAPRIKSEIVKFSNKLKMKSPKLIENLTTMGEIVNKAYSLAVSGDIVLLSPASASFGLFKNYKERGMLFKKYVNNL